MSVANEGVDWNSLHPRGDCSLGRRLNHISKFSHCKRLQNGCSYVSLLPGNRSFSPRDLQRSDPRSTDPEQTWVSNSSVSQLTKRGPLIRSPNQFLMDSILTKKRSHLYFETAEKYCNPYHPWDWYDYLHENHKNQPFRPENIPFFPWILWVTSDFTRKKNTHLPTFNNLSL